MTIENVATISDAFEYFAGYEGIACGLSASYTGIAQVLNEVYGRTVLPLGVVYEEGLRCSMARPLFTATKRFDSSDGEAWYKYVSWAKIPNLVELVTLDGILCPSVIPVLNDEDWNHNVHEDFQTDYFYDFKYLKSRIANIPRMNLLGLYRNPDEQITCPPGDDNFVFLGYDLIEERTGVSALTNCGGFTETFSNDELSQQGLIRSFVRAREIRDLLPINNPDQPHAHCEMYAIWRLES